ncbi:MAG: NAD(P)H-hydrate dehydratase [Gammaproteobacteria bacterium]|nr:NAD(P)H-hydrate dehydratase [Gammaproteobacteria bacterium]
MSLDSTFYSAEQVREWDSRLIEHRDLSAYQLMCEAGEALFAEFTQRYAARKAPCVLAGGGNNAGDGYVFARLAKQQGMDVTVRYLKSPEHLMEAAADAWEAARDAGVDIAPFEQGLPAGTDCVIDAMFGTGLDREVEGEWRAAIEATNAAGLPVAAADIPSGLHADTGRVLGAAIAADLTVTFVARKAGMHTGRGPDVCGEIVFHDLGTKDFDPADRPALCDVLERRHLPGLLPRRRQAGHKGEFGHLLVIAGQAGMPGAARLAAEGAMRSGVGKVSVRCHADSVLAVQAARPELMVDALENGVPAGITACVAGPGLGADIWGTEAFEQALALALPMVIDADGLRLLARKPALAQHLHADTVLTPHPGEAAALLETDVAHIENDRLTAARELAERFGCHIVLKGAGSLVASPGGKLSLCAAGSVALATAGSGDVLAGIIAAFLAHEEASHSGFGDDGKLARRAAQAGVLLHALAGERIALDGPRGAIASDIVRALRLVLKAADQHE